MIYINQGYITIELDTEISLASASAPLINYKKPNGNTGAWIGVISGTKITYEVQEDDLNLAGVWKLQGECTIDSRTAYTDVVDMVVKNLFVN